MADFPKIIWLVEDEKAYADSLSYILNNISGLQCTKHFVSFEDLDEHLKTPFYTKAPDLVLMDISLGEGKSGIEAVRHLGKTMPGIPVVMMTMYDDKKRILEALKAGAVGYMVKGAPYDQVVETIKAAIGGKLVLDEPVRDKLLNHLQEETEPKAYELTERQLEVLGLMCDGLSKADIAERLDIQHATADNHFRHIYERLGVNSAHAAVALALREGLIPLAK